MYENWTKEDLIWKIRMLDNEIENLYYRIQDKDTEIDHLNFRIEQELEPRIQAERRAYDRWVTDPER